VQARSNPQASCPPSCPTRQSAAEWGSAMWRSRDLVRGGGALDVEGLAHLPKSAATDAPQFGRRGLSRAGAAGRPLTGEECGSRYSAVRGDPRPVELRHAPSVTSCAGIHLREGERTRAKLPGGMRDQTADSPSPSDQPSLCPSSSHDLDTASAFSRSQIQPTNVATSTGYA
jgi:hypothetical protein